MAKGSPIISRPTYGSFVLRRTGADPLYTYFAIERYVASFNNGPGVVSITGSGRYRIGGEVALSQQMTLDLAIEGQPPVHFDSGLKPVSVPFPQIDISCAVHGFDCFDTVIVVDAKPVYPAGTPPVAPLAGLESVRPNPFTGRTSIVLTLAQDGPADLAVLDLEGRRVRELVAGSLSSGEHVYTWEGRRDDGRDAPAGVYWILMRWQGGIDRRRVVKLD